MNKTVPVTFSPLSYHDLKYINKNQYIVKFVSSSHFINIKKSFFVSVNSSEICNGENSSLPQYLYVFMLGQFLHGFGGTILYSLGIVFIDANVKTKDSPLYQGKKITFHFRYIGSSW